MNPRQLDTYVGVWYDAQEIEKNEKASLLGWWVGEKANPNDPTCSAPLKSNRHTKMEHRLDHKELRHSQLDPC